MRNALLALLAAFFAVAIASPNIFSPFIEPFILNFLGVRNDSRVNELRRRQDTDCPDGYGNNCAGIGALGLCCPDDSVCSADSAGNPACCSAGAACTGTIASTRLSVIDTDTITTGAPGTETTIGGIVGGTIGDDDDDDDTTTFVFASETTSSDDITAAATGTTTDSFIIPSSGATISTVPNPFYPIAILPATYGNADACSSAYSSCVADIRNCGAALQGSATADIGGITISAPNGGGTTVDPRPTTTLGPDAASSVCNSLSTRACGTFTVEQCSIFGTGTATADPTNDGAREDVSKVMMNVALVLAIAWQAGEIIDDWLAL